MSAAKRAKKKVWFAGVPMDVAKSNAFAELTALELKLLMELVIQYNGRNNGNLTAAHAVLKKRGWSSAGSLYKAFKGLLSKGWIVITRQGWKQRGRPTLLAITWNGIDELPHGSKIEYDDGIKVSPTPLGYWCTDPRAWTHKPRGYQNNPSSSE